MQARETEKVLTDPAALASPALPGVLHLPLGGVTAPHPAPGLPALAAVLQSLQAGHHTRPLARHPRIGLLLFLLITCILSVIFIIFHAYSYINFTS